MSDKVHLQAVTNLDIVPSLILKETTMAVRKKGSGTEGYVCNPSFITEWQTARPPGLVRLTRLAIG